MNIDDDVKVWVSARVVAQENREFSVAQIATQAQKLFRAEQRKVERFAQDHCVANTAGADGRHFNYLFRLANGKYRLFKQGDPIEYSHAMSPTSPEVHRVPPAYKNLFAASSTFPQELRPAVDHETTTAAAKSAPRPAATRPTASSPASTVASLAGVATKGLKADLPALAENTPANLARRTIHDLLFLEFGQVGSQLDAQDRQSFNIGLEDIHGMVRTRENLLVRMPEGTGVGHLADIVIETENPPRTLYIDIVEAAHHAEELKAHAFDAIHLRKNGKSQYAILVFIRTPNGTLQEQAEAIAYGYDFFFGVDATQVKDANKFYALKSQVVQWVQGKTKTAAV